MVNLKFNRFNLLTSLIIAMGFSFALSSCSDNEDPTPPDETEDNVEISMLINVGKSRAVSDDVEDVDGTWDENFINPQLLHVLVYTSPSNGNYGGSFSTELPIKSSVRISGTTYQVKLGYESLPSGTFNIVVLANWPYTIDQRSTLGNNYRYDNPGFLCVMRGAEYPYHYGKKSTAYEYTTAYTVTETTVDYRSNGEASYYTPSHDTPMPMFGIKTFNASSFNGQTTINLGEIDLIRSMAKLVIKANSKYKISKASLRYCYDVGMCGCCDNTSTFYTTGTNTDTYVMEVGKQDNMQDFVNVPYAFTTSYGEGFNDENPLRVIQNVPFKDYGDNRFVLYIPAYNNNAFKNINTYKNYIDLTVNDEDYTIEFRNLDSAGNYTNTYYNLCRNFMYIYNIKLDSGLSYTVSKFDDYTSADITFK